MKINIGQTDIKNAIGKLKPLDLFTAWDGESVNMVVNGDPKCCGYICYVKLGYVKGIQSQLGQMFEEPPQTQVTFLGTLEVTE